jgi:WD40 repeat protein
VNRQPQSRVSGGRPLLASGGNDGTVPVWDPATGAPVGDPLPHPGRVPRVFAVAFGADAGGRPLLASGCDDGTVRPWDLVTGTAIVTLLRRTAPAAARTGRWPGTAMSHSISHLWAAFG